MTHYKILYHDRNYNEFTLYDAHTHEEITEHPECLKDFVPGKNKLFHTDVFSIDEDGTIHIVHSIVRETVQYHSPFR